MYSHSNAIFPLGCSYAKVPSANLQGWWGLPPRECLASSWLCQTTRTCQFLSSMNVSSKGSFPMNRQFANSQCLGAVFTDLQEKGIAVFAFDAHGFGRSEPEEASSRLFILTMQYMVDDVLTFREVLHVVLHVVATCL